MLSWVSSYSENSMVVAAWHIIAQWREMSSQPQNPIMKMAEKEEEEEEIQPEIYCKGERERNSQ